MAITSLDQLDEELDYIMNGTKVKSSLEIFIHSALNVVINTEGYLSYGPTRNTLHWAK